MDSVSAMAKNCVSLERLEQEIQKCRLVCAYCHLKRTFEQRRERTRHYKNNWAKARPQKQKRQKLSDKEVTEIKRRYEVGESVKQIHNDFTQVSYTQIWVITHGKSRAKVNLTHGRPSEGSAHL